MQRGDFMGLFEAMAGLPVVIRLLDPPLHEFLPSHDDLQHDLAGAKLRLQHHDRLADIDATLAEIRAKQDQHDRVSDLREANPMLGTRGVRLGLLIPELSRMQVRAIVEAACLSARKGLEVPPEIMIPLVAHVNELRSQRAERVAEAEAVMRELNVRVPYRFGAMIELPRAALTADRIAEESEFFSFGTNDLTQTVFGISRDDAEKGFLLEYMERGILPDDPFATLDQDGVGRIVREAVEAGRAARPALEIGICGEHGGDPRSIAFCHRAGLDYVSCAPFSVPIARLAAAHAALAGPSPRPRRGAKRDAPSRRRRSPESPSLPLAAPRPSGSAPRRHARRAGGPARPSPSSPRPGSLS